MEIDKGMTAWSLCSVVVQKLVVGWSLYQAMVANYTILQLAGILLNKNYTRELCLCVLWKFLAVYLTADKMPSRRFKDQNHKEALVR